MKRTLSSLLVMLVLLCAVVPVSTEAATPRVLSIIPGLSINGTTALCELAVVGDYSTDEYSAVIRLWEVNTCVATWRVSDTGSIDFSTTHTVNLNKKHTLTADVTVNGVEQDRVMITRYS